MHSAREIQTRRFIALHLQMRFRKPRRADARRSCEHAFVHRECRYFSADRHRATRAAGVSQPWETNSGASALHYHGGLTPAALVDVHLCIAKIVFCRQAFATQYKSGRRKPTVANQHYCTSVSNSHGGLTPAALGNVRFCTANVAFHCEQTPCNQERGRKPPVVSLHAMATVIGPQTAGGFPSNRPRVCVNVSAEPRRAHARRSWSNVRLCSANVAFCSEVRCAPRLPFSPANRHRATRSGGRKPPVVSLHAMATVIGPHTAGGFPSNRPRVCVNVSPEPRRADARRSWSRSFPGKSRSFTVIAFRKPRRAHARRSCKRAFVHRECRFLQRSSVRTAAVVFSGEPALCNQERGRKFPRGVHSARAIQTRNFIALHFQMRFGKPRRADARRPCQPAFAHRECRFSQRTNVVQPRAGGVSPRGERNESADGIRMCGGRVPGRSDVPVEFAAGVRTIPVALAFPTWSGWREPAV
jgi:hypothetical protein